MLDAILDRVNPRELKDRSFRFFFGHGDHEYIFTVRAITVKRTYAIASQILLPVCSQPGRQSDRTSSVMLTEGYHQFVRVLTDTMFQGCFP